MAVLALVLFFQSLWLVSADARQVIGPAIGNAVPNRFRRWSANVCYPDVGCFNNAAPFNNAYDEVPSKPEDIGTKFHLYTRSNSDFPQQLTYNDGGNSLRVSFFNKDLPVKFIIHGFTESIDAPWLKRMSDAFLKKEPMNVILTGWKEGAKEPYYPKAAANTRLVGRQIGLLVNLMVSMMGSTYDKVHLTGHSLGAHISGYAGAYLDGKIGRITGLDPAGPFFESYPTVVRLDKSDAKFVDIIHSNGVSITSGGAGLSIVSGHVDFYPNGGEFQPGCGDPVQSTLGELFSGDFEGAGNAVACSHNRAFDLFTASIGNNRAFTSYSCSDWDSFSVGDCFDCSRGRCSQMGYYADQYKATGKMYLQTLDESPFYGFQYLVKLTVADDSQGLVKIRVVGENGVSDVLELSEQTDTLKTGDPLQQIFITQRKLGNIKDVQVFYDKQDRLLWGFVAGGSDALTIKSAVVTAGESKQKWRFNQVQVPDDTWVSTVTKKTISDFNTDGGIVIG
ncbi:pancreatic triacylglycerol lipase-like [Lingula anatina]|uniref:Pancreatic triacylglycerol lipase-like n=1 Tax=Lingula anatina TaxID=7574 RepID=A0A1S3JVZ0_LINAN|nr:pancreatic triacylglycerol lipase-like [Lingula anatina]|eukprot:XP_013414570.2 pancreatic triacylglycerol lipase-like [Lingula anatina]